MNARSEQQHPSKSRLLSQDAPKYTLRYSCCNTLWDEQGRCAPSKQGRFSFRRKEEPIQSKQLCPYCASKRRNADNFAAIRADEERRAAEGAAQAHNGPPPPYSVYVTATTFAIPRLTARQGPTQSTYRYQKRMSTQDLQAPQKTGQHNSRTSKSSWERKYNPAEGERGGPGRISVAKRS